MARGGAKGFSISFFFLFLYNCYSEYVVAVCALFVSEIFVMVSIHESSSQQVSCDGLHVITCSQYVFVSEF